MPKIPAAERHNLYQMMTGMMTEVRYPRDHMSL
jgi:hypothetical protein